MSSVIQLTWPEVARTKDALITIEKIMTECNTATLELKSGLIVNMDPIGIRIEGSIKFDELEKPV